MRAYIYPANIEEYAPGDFVVRFRDVPEAITGGGTLDEALEQAPDCLACAVEGYLERGWPVPDPSAALQGEHNVPLDLDPGLRVLLVKAMRTQGLTNVALAERLQIDEKGVRRILSGKGASLSRTLQALRAAGVNPALAA